MEPLSEVEQSFFRRGEELDCTEYEEEDEPASFLTRLFRRQLVTKPSRPDEWERLLAFAKARAEFD